MEFRDVPSTDTKPQQGNITEFFWENFKPVFCKLITTSNKPWLYKYMKKAYRIFSNWARSKRGRIFIRYLQPSEKDKILDLGGGTGSHISRILPFRENIWIADINQNHLELGQKLYGFTKTILIGERSTLPFPDKFFDIVFCSSVIEHVTLNKNNLKAIRKNKEFYEVSYKRQQEFAREIQRVGKHYFVQTPYKYFLIESHTWMPFIFVLLPRSVQITIIEYNNKWWPKKTSPDWNLLTTSQVRGLFPEAEIVLEKVLFFTKSIMAIKS